VVDVLYDEKYKAKKLLFDYSVSPIFLNKITILHKILEWRHYYPCIIDPSGICFEYLIE